MMFSDVDLSLVLPKKGRKKKTSRPARLRLVIFAWNVQSQFKQAFFFFLIELTVGMKLRLSAAPHVALVSSLSSHSSQL